MSNELQTRKSYATDLTDEQWVIVEPLIPSAKNRYGGRPRTICMREVDALRTQIRLAEGREATPSGACIDTQSVKTTEVGGDERGYDGGKNIQGRKRHLLVDTLGLLMAVVVTGANADDGSAAPELLETVSPDKFPRRRTILGDNTYRNQKLEHGLKKERPAWSVEIQMRPKDSPGFTPVRKRWVVERSNAWHGRCRRNSQDYERRPDSSAAMIPISHIHVMLRRLGPAQPPKFNDRMAA